MSNTINPVVIPQKNNLKMRFKFYHRKNSITKTIISNTLYYKSAKNPLKRGSKWPLNGVILRMSKKYNGMNRSVYEKNISVTIMAINTLFRWIVILTEKTVILKRSKRVTL